MTIVISPEIALTKGMERIKGRLPEELKDLIKPIDWDNLSFEGELFEDPTSNDIDFEAEEFPISTPIARGLEIPSIPRGVNVYDGLVSGGDRAAGFIAGLRAISAAEGICSCRRRSISSTGFTQSKTDT